MDWMLMLEFSNTVLILRQGSLPAEVQHAQSTQALHTFISKVILTASGNKKLAAGCWRHKAATYTLMELAESHNSHLENDVTFPTP